MRSIPHGMSGTWDESTGSATFFFPFSVYLYDGNKVKDKETAISKSRSIRYLRFTLSPPIDS